MQQMGDIILEAAKLVLEAMPLLSIDRQECRPGSMRSPKRSSAIEEQRRPDPRPGPQGALSRQPKGDAHGNAMNFIIGTELYDHLEKVVDRFEDVSNEINAIVIDHL